MATVSVIMPAFNVALYVAAAIESVRAQTVQDWELLVVDDGSTDETAAVVSTLAAKDPRVRLLSQANGGISAARNHAIGESVGEFLAILDSDDLWEPRYLEAQLEIFRRHPHVDVVTGNGWFLGGRQHGRPARPWPDSRPHPTLAAMLADETAVFIMSVMRRRVYQTIGGFDVLFRSNEDYDFWLRAAAAGFQFARNDEPLGHYRRRDDSVSADDVKMLSGILRVLEKTRPLLSERPEELRILEAQVARFEGERLAAAAKAALSAGHADTAVHLTALYDQRGGALLKIATWMARWTPKLLTRAYQFRKARQEAAS